MLKIQVVASAERFYLEPNTADFDKNSLTRAMLESFANVVNDYLSVCGNLDELVFNEKRIIQSVNDIIGPTLISNELNIEFSTGEEIFHCLAATSSLTYESSVARGLILFNFETNPKLIVSFTSYMLLSYSKAVRKLLEMTSSKLALVVNKNLRVIGLSQTDPNRFGWVRFRKQSIWEFGCKSETSLCTVVESIVKASYVISNDNDFKKLIKITFENEIDSDNIQILDDIVREARKQKTGTIVAISLDAEKEAKRLHQKSSFLIEPIRLVGDNLSLVSQFTSIDGAMMIDLNGVCYGIGIVLDGIASNRGSDPGRGSRYACGFMYVDYREKMLNSKTVVIIVSEDGPVDVICPESVVAAPL